MEFGEGFKRDNGELSDGELNDRAQRITERAMPKILEIIKSIPMKAGSTATWTEEELASSLCRIAFDALEVAAHFVDSTNPPPGGYRNTMRTMAVLIDEAEVEFQNDQEI